MMLIDTHCHLNFPDKFPDAGEAIEEAKAAGVGRMIAVGCDPATSRAAVALAKQFPEVYAIVGWHPTYTSKYVRASLREIEGMFKDPKVVALGEIGLDFYWDYATREEQKRALLDQLDLAATIEKPVVFHCREAYPELLEILEARSPHPYLFHCFAGDSGDAKRALKLGALFGVDGPITYKNSHVLRDVIRRIPADRLVLETDSPYMPPVPYRGKPNRPAYVTHVNDALAAVLEIPAADCAALTTATAIRFFGM